MDWINLAQDRRQWQALVSMAMNLQIHKILRNFPVVEQLAAS
jgi:hypothetical protein